MRVIDVDKFIKDMTLANRMAANDFPVGYDLDSFNTGVYAVLEILSQSPDVFEIEKTAKTIKYPNGCHDCDVDCEECDHHRSVEWCALAIKDRDPVDPAYETGWGDGFEEALGSSQEYNFGYIDGWDEGWEECYNSFKTAINRIFEDNK